MIHVLIVEDDPMVADLNREYISQMENFHPVGMASDVEEAFTYLEEVRVDLILLDIYMPGQDGLQLLKQLRGKDTHIDVILITAASEKGQIQQALRLGAVDYLIKPFEFERLKEALRKYSENYSVLGEMRNVSQKEVDKIFSAQKEENGKRDIEIPKGLTKTTLLHIIRIIHDQEESFSTDEIARKADVSRVSVRKYLKFLKEIGFLEETLIYGVGRPVYQYQRTDMDESNIGFRQ